MGQPFYLKPDGRAYNGCIDALNEVDEQIIALIEERDRIWVAAEAILGTRTHGRYALPRNPIIKKGAVKARA